MQTPIHIDNTTAVGIVTSSIKQARSSCSMEMRYFWLMDRKAQKKIAFHYQPGQENMADYKKKHHTVAIHQYV